MSGAIYHKDIAVSTVPHFQKETQNPWNLAPLGDYRLYPIKSPIGARSSACTTVIPFPAHPLFWGFPHPSRTALEGVARREREKAGSPSGNGMTLMDLTLSI